MSEPVKAALVTGGSGALGAAICRRLAAEGFVVGVGYCASPEAAAAVVDAVEKKGGRALAVRIDVADANSVKTAVRDFSGDAGRLDVLVASAGVTYNNLALLTGEEALRRLLDINVAGVFHSAKAAARAMLAGNGGRIILIGSVAGLAGNPGQAAYAASKAALVGLAKSLAREFAPRGILVNVVAPGLIDTGEGGMVGGIPAERMDEILSRVALGRAGRPEDVAAAVAYLAGPDGAYVTGQTLVVDGGLTMM